MSRCCAIIVTYNPDGAVLSQLVDVIKPSVEQVLIVSNGGDLPADLGTETILNRENIGLSSALNQGIAWGEAHGFSEVLLFDQDSHPSLEMVPELRNALASLQQSGKKIAAVGPVYVDPRSGVVFPFLRWHLPKNIEVLGDPGETVTADFLITSGTLIPMDAIRDVGLMDDTLFIDNIDTDWCLRALEKDYQLRGVMNAKMLHSIGSEVFTARLPFGYSKELFIHSPLRLYYIMRNRILLYRRKHVSWTWILQDIHRAINHLTNLIMFLPDRSLNLPAALRGLVHGIIGRSGPMRF